MPILTIYFDGLCRLCSAEMNHYRKLPESRTISFVDITDKEFSAEKQGLDPFLVHKVMHVRGQDGKIHTGVDAFIHIWQVFAKYRTLARIAEYRIPRAALELGYRTFVVIRPFLPRKKKQDCSDSPYCEL